MKIRPLALLLLLCLHHVLYSQTNLDTGYVITHTNDTLYGKLKYKKAKSTVSLYNAKSENKLSYTPEQLKGFGFTEGKVYRSTAVTFDEGKQQAIFARALVTGKASLLKLSNNFIILFQDSAYFISHAEKTVKINDQTFSTKNNRQFGLIRYYLLSDCPTLNKDVFSAKSAKKLSELIIAYNQCVGEDFVEHNSKKPWSKFEWGLSAGASVSKIKFTNNPYSNDYPLASADFTPAISPVFALNLVVSSPRINERLSLQADLLFEKASYQAALSLPAQKTSYDYTVETTSLRVPLTLKHTVYQGKVNGYWRAGLTAGKLISKDFRWIWKDESSDNGATYGDSYPHWLENQLGYTVTLGASRQIFRGYKGYLEVNFDKTKPFPYNGLRAHPALHSSQLRVVFGILH